MNISRQIKSCRNKLDISQEKLAEEIGVSRQTISNWENDKSYPDLKSLLLLSEYFKISLDELVKGDMEKMKSELQKNQMNSLSRIMLISAVLMFLSIPIVKISSYGFIITVIFMIIMLWASIKIEIIKKDKNLHTYKEIKAYMENNEIPTEDKIECQGKFWVKKVLIAIVCAIVSGTLASLILKYF